MQVSRAEEQEQRSRRNEFPDFFGDLVIPVIKKI
jgi:hypothetical protein